MTNKGFGVTCLPVDASCLAEPGVPEDAIPGTDTEKE